MEDNWRRTVEALEAQVEKLSHVEAEVTRKMVDDRVRGATCRGCGYVCAAGSRSRVNSNHDTISRCTALATPPPPPQDLADSELRRAHEVSELHRTKAERLAKVVEQKEEHIVYLTNEHKEEVAWLEAKIKKAKEEQEKENASRLEHMRGHLMEMYVVLGCARGRLACVGC